MKENNYKREAELLKYIEELLKEKQNLLKYIGDYQRREMLIAVERLGNHEILKEELVEIFARKEIEIKNGIGIFDDTYIDYISIEPHNNGNNKLYEVVPIDGKIAIPRIKEGMVTAYYKKWVKGKTIIVKREDYPKEKGD